jgi:hypothetical protein
MNEYGRDVPCAEQFCSPMDLFDRTDGCPCESVTCGKFESGLSIDEWIICDRQVTYFLNLRITKYGAGGGGNQAVHGFVRNGCRPTIL